MNRRDDEQRRQASDMSSVHDESVDDVRLQVGATHRSPAWLAPCAAILFAAGAPHIAHAQGQTRQQTGPKVPAASEPVQFWEAVTSRVAALLSGPHAQLLAIPPARMPGGTDIIGS